MRDAFLHNVRAEGLIRRGDRVLVACSGGADSVALLHLLAGAAAQLGCEVEAGHLDHGLRAESGAEAGFVRRLCGELGVPLTVERRDVARLAADGRGNLEETARAARRKFLEELAGRRDCAVIALGHHRDDQAETFLLRLLRGSGASGLAAMRPLSGPYVRPLLPFSRSRITAYLEENRLRWVDDASNEDLAFTRNRIRHQLLPLLRTFNPRIEAHLAGLSDRLGREEDFWRTQEDRALDEARLPGPKGGVELDCRRLGQLHPALGSRVVRRALEEVRGDLRGLTSRHLEALEALVQSARPQADLHLPRAWAGRRYGRLKLQPEPPQEPAALDVKIAGPACVLLPDGRRLCVTREGKPRGEGPGAVEFAASRVGFPLTVRTFRSGDRFRPAGSKGRKKLKDFFIDAKIDRETRRSVPLVVGEEILWVVGLRRGAGGRAEGGGQVLRLALSSPGAAEINL